MPPGGRVREIKKVSGMGMRGMGMKEWGEDNGSEGNGEKIRG